MKRTLWLFLIKLWVRFVKPPRFRKWIQLEECKERVIGAVGKKAANFPREFYALISTALSIHEKVLGELYWDDLLPLFYLSLSLNPVPQHLPIIKYSPKNQKPDIVSWDYDGRTWHQYAHLLAHAYGWSLEYIANLPVAEAFAQLEEILTEQQLNREFEWTTTEVAYPYNKSTKKSEFKALPRPYWMLNKSKEIPKIRIRKDMMPVGNIVDESGGL